jgi:hypothetical protein
MARFFYHCRQNDIADDVTAVPGRSAENTPCHGENDRGVGAGPGIRQRTNPSMVEVAASLA